VRGNEHTAEIPFIMLTTRRDTSMVEKSLQKGATDYLIKPFKSAQLGMKVVMALACSDYMAPVQIDENLHIRISEEEEALRKASGQ
jgi:PleD family two-component response regulator